MLVKCPHCKVNNDVPAKAGNLQYRCHRCGTSLPKPSEDNGDASAFVGLIGGATLGAAIGGPIGAIIGGILGGILGKEAKGIG